MASFKITVSLGIILLACFVLKVNAKRDCLTQYSQDLIDEVNKYRSVKVTCDQDLAYMAFTHSDEQQKWYDSHSNGQTLYTSQCNLHSWRFYSAFKCCYPDDHSNAQCMWKIADHLKKKLDVSVDVIGNVYELSNGPFFVGNFEDFTFDNFLDGFVSDVSEDDLLRGTGIWTSITRAGCAHVGKFVNCYFQ